MTTPEQTAVLEPHRWQRVGDQQQRLDHEEDQGERCVQEQTQGATSTTSGGEDAAPIRPRRPRDHRVRLPGPRRHRSMSARSFTRWPNAAMPTAGDQEEPSRTRSSPRAAVRPAGRARRRRRSARPCVPPLPGSDEPRTGVTSVGSGAVLPPDGDHQQVPRGLAAGRQDRTGRPRGRPVRRAATPDRRIRSPTSASTSGSWNQSVHGGAEALLASVDRRRPAGRRRRDAGPASRDGRRPCGGAAVPGRARRARRSRNGVRTSRPWAIDARSVFTRMSPGR